MTCGELRESRNAEGFTLLEMLIVLAVLALVVAVVVPGMGTFRRSDQAELVARQVAGLMVRARMGALATGFRQSVSIDLAQRTVRYGASPAVRVPDDINTVLRVGSELVRQQSAAVVYFPDGSSTGVDIMMSDANEMGWVVRVSWLTGLVEVSAQP